MTQPEALLDAPIREVAYAFNDLVQLPQWSRIVDFARAALQAQGALQAATEPAPAPCGICGLPRVTACSCLEIRARQSGQRLSLDVQVAAVRREISMREHVYPRWVENGKMTQRKADDEIAAMQAVLETLLEQQATTRLL